MTLSAGDHVGPYEILGPLGRGGMGEVYRARDPRLQREVALKVIRDGAPGSDNLSRFQRETRAVAALNHPGILAIYDTGLHADAPYAVMELLSGETLAERLLAGPLPEREAREIAARIADGLAAAHARGIVHRDVKPSNVFLTRDGQTKLLDFGIARVSRPIGAAETSEATPAEALTSGGLVGTPGYVSPEQIRGKDPDARSDVFALGATLFESLTGRRTFAGSTAAEALSQILTADPAQYAETSRISPPLRRVVLRCLEKDPANRYQSARDVALDLRANETGTLTEPPPIPGERRRNRAAAAAGLVLLGAGVLLGRGLLSRRSPSPDLPVTRAAILLTPVLTASSAERPLFEISPDGQRLVFVADVEGRTRLFLRDLDGLEPLALPGTENGTGPFFSPDGRSIGFFAGTDLKKLVLGESAPATLRPVPPVSRGAAWGPDGSIVYSPVNTGGLVRLDPSTGKETALLEPDYEQGEHAYRWPQFLPGGDAVLFTIYTGGDSFDAASIAVVGLDGRNKKVLARGGTNPRYSPTGHLLYARGGTLMAAPFDLERLETTGSAAAVVSGVRTEGTGAAQYAFSGEGTLLYLPGPSPNRPGMRVVRVDRAGLVEPLTRETGAYAGPRFSPDGRQVSFAKGDANQDVWILDLERGTETRLTPEASEEFDAFWSPDGERIAYTCERRAVSPQIFARQADGSGEERLIRKGNDTVIGQSWYPDGKSLAFLEFGPAKDWDIWAADDGAQAARALVKTPYDEGEPDVSPDGRWLAYVSNESGRYEVYARALSGRGERIAISTEGGREPVWSRDGGELFYRNGERVMAVPVRAGESLSAGRPAVVLRKPGLLALAHLEFRQYDVSADGRSFVMIQLPDGEAPATAPVLVTNWFAELRRKSAADR